MKDIMRIADIIKQRIENNYAQDIAIFAYYGSYATGHQDELSDLDFFFIPKTDRGRELNLQFIIDGIGFDLFPIPWERIARIASLEQPLTAVITKAEVLFSANDEDLTRFNSIKEKLDGLFHTDNSEYLLSKSTEYVNSAIVSLYNMENAKDLVSLKVESHKLLSNILLAVGFANNTYYTRTIGMSVSESFELEHLPNQYESLVNNIIQSSSTSDIMSYSRRLIQNTRGLIEDRYLQDAEKEPIETLFTGYYEELKSGLNKVLRACSKEDMATAFFRSASIQNEIAQFLSKAEAGHWFDNSDCYDSYRKHYEELIGINLLSHINDLNTLESRIQELDRKFKQLLIANNVDILSFDSIDDFEKHYLGA